MFLRVDGTFYALFSILYSQLQYMILYLSLDYQGEGASYGLYAVVPSQFYKTDRFHFTQIATNMVLGRSQDISVPTIFRMMGPSSRGAFNRTKYLDRIAQTWVAKICTKTPCKASNYITLCWVQNKDQSWKTKNVLSFVRAMHSREVLLINSKTSCPEVFQFFTYVHIHSWEVLLIRPLSTPAAKATTWPWSRPTHTHLPACHAMKMVMVIMMIKVVVTTHTHTHTHLPACHALKMAIMLMMMIDQGVSLRLSSW